MASPLPDDQETTVRTNRAVDGRRLRRPKATAPQPPRSAAEIEQETARLLAVCAERGVAAVLPDVGTCPELLRPLADACHSAGLIEAAQYLLYLEFPLD